MKKIAVLLLSLSLLLVAMVGTFSASATVKHYTKEDILNKISESAIYHYIEGEVKNVARGADLTQEQLDQLYVVAEKFVALNLADKGKSADTYSPADVAAVMELIDEGCAITNYTYTFEPAPKSHHAGDVVFKLYAPNNQIALAYEADAVSKTGADQTVWFVSIALLGCALLAAAVVVKAKKANA